MEGKRKKGREGGKGKKENRGGREWKEREFDPSTFQILPPPVYQSVSTPEISP